MEYFHSPLVHSPLFPIIADIVMQNLEKIVILNLQVHPLFYYRYVDNIIFVLASENISDMLTIFNSLHTRFYIQFTVEIDIDNN